MIVYALELADGVAVIDTGWSTDEAWTALTGGLRTAGFAVTDVRAALITHIHPDHYGLAGRLREESGAWVALHPADAALLPARYGIGIDTLITGMRNLLQECGVPPEVLEELTGASMGIREFVALAEPDVLLEDRARIDLPGWDLVALHTPGHSPGHVCFYDRERRLLISRDTCPASAPASRSTRSRPAIRWPTFWTRSCPCAASAWTRCCPRTSGGSAASRPEWTSLSSTTSGVRSRPRR